MASLRRNGAASGGGTAQGRRSAAIVRIGRPAAAANDNRLRLGERLYRRLPIAAMAALLAAALWTVLSQS